MRQVLLFAAAFLAGCAATGTIIVGNDGAAFFASDELRKCPGEHFTLTIDQQDQAGNPLPSVVVDGYAAAGSIQFSAKGIDFGRPVRMKLQGKCGDIRFPLFTNWIALRRVPDKPNVYIVDFRQFHPGE